MEANKQSKRHEKPPKIVQAEKDILHFFMSLDPDKFSEQGRKEWKQKYYMHLATLRFKKQ